LLSPLFIVIIVLLLLLASQCCCCCLVVVVVVVIIVRLRDKSGHRKKAGKGVALTAWRWRILKEYK